MTRPSVVRGGPLTDAVCVASTVPADAPSAAVSFAMPKSSTFTPPVVGDHHVRRLDVAVDDAGGVRLRQRVGDLNRVATSRRRAAGSFRAITLIERLALDELHRDEVDAVFAADVVDGDDAGMVQRRGGLRFLDEAAAAGGIGGRFGRQGP